MNSPMKTAAIPMLRKITPKTIFEALGKDLAKLGDVRPVPSQVLYDIFGTISGVKQKADDKNTDKGVWTQFKGRFRAVVVDAATGEVRQFESGATHIPVLEDIILSTFLSAKDADPRAQIEIALRVAIKTATPGKPSMTGYEYDVQRLLPETENAQDPIVLLMQAAAKANPPQLAAPEPKVEAKAEEVAAEPAAAAASNRSNRAK